MFRQRHYYLNACIPLLKKMHLMITRVTRWMILKKVDGPYNPFLKLTLLDTYVKHHIIELK